MGENEAVVHRVVHLCSASTSQSLDFSGDESEPQTPVKKRSNRSSRAVTPEKSKSGLAAATGANANGGGKANGSALTRPPQGEEEDEQQEWTKYLGGDEEEKSSIVIRFPDGTRESKELPCSSKFKVKPSYPCAGV